MRCVLMTALGAPVDPDVNRNLAIVSGPTASCAASTAGVTASSSRPTSSPYTTSTPAGTAAAIAGAYAPRCDAYTSPGVSSSTIPRSRAKSVDSSEYAGEIGAYGTPAT